MVFILCRHSPIIAVDGECGLLRINGSITQHFQRHEIRHKQAVSGNPVNCRLEHAGLRGQLGERASDDSTTRESI